MYFAIYSQTAKIKNESNNTIHELSVPTVPLIIPNFCCAKKEKKIGERKIYIYIYLTSTVRFKSFDIEVRGLRNGRVADYPPAETFFFFYVSDTFSPAWPAASHVFPMHVTTRDRECFSPFRTHVQPTAYKVYFNSSLPGHWLNPNTLETWCTHRGEIERKKNNAFRRLFVCFRKILFILRISKNKNKICPNYI